MLSPLGKLGGSKGAWGEAPPPTVVTSELWGAPMGKSRGPPPGISNKNAPGSAVTGGGNSGSGSGVGGSNNNSNGWASAGGSVGGSAGTATNVTGGVGGSGGGRSASWGIQGSAAGTWGSTWLLLRNLTPQVRNNHRMSSCTCGV